MEVEGGHERVPRIVTRALTVRQPWAWAIIHAGKNIENRGWTNKYVTGTIAIHAGGGRDRRHRLPRGTMRPSDEDLVRGAIIGVVDVVAVVKRHRSKWFSGPLGWVLRNPRPLGGPLKCSGRLGLWRLSRRLRRAVEAQLGRDVDKQRSRAARVRRRAPNL